MMVSYNTFFGAKLTDGVLILVVVDDGLVLPLAVGDELNFTS